jgi:hypothetical protein
MALALGTASVVYNVVDVWLVRELPFRNADRLVSLWRTRVIRASPPISLPARTIATGFTAAALLKR